MNADGTGVVQVTTAGGAKPDWSLDGMRIVFHATRNRNADTWAMNPTARGKCSSRAVRRRSIPRRGGRERGQP
jgi:Tol biopolymer transport system component